MDERTLVALAVAVFVWAIFSEWLAARNITGPLVFLATGFFIGNPRWGIVDVDVESSTVHGLAEITLGLLLFSDASKVRLAAARRDLRLTARLLGIGLPLSILAGTACALVFFPSLPLALAGLLGASLAPTDAALSAAVIEDERLPKQVRRVLNVESGLNDGIATPVVSVCIAAAAAVLGIAAHGEDGVGALVELAIGVGIGGATAVVGGLALGVARRHGWMQHGAARLATLALAGSAFLLAMLANGNPFVSAFVGGLIFGATVPKEAKEPVDLTERFGSLLSLVLWFIFGAAFLLPAFEHLDGWVLMYSLLALTLLRMVPVAIALLGSGERMATTLFVGWFGPRGLASVVFALLAVEELGQGDPRVQTVLNTIAVTITFSVVAHGISARPLAARYVKAVG